MRMDGGAGRFSSSPANKNSAPSARYFGASTSSVAHSLILILVVSRTKVSLESGEEWRRGVAGEGEGGRDTVTQEVVRTGRY